MLRIADMPLGLQYGLSQDGVFLFIHMARDFAREVAPQVGRIAYNNQSRITKLEDIDLLADFIPYKDGRPWGYGSCLQVEADGDTTESWKVALPPWREGIEGLEGIQQQIQAFLTLEAVFAGINVPSALCAKNARPQRVEVDLNYDPGSGLFTIKAEVGQHAMEKLFSLRKPDFKYVRESMMMAVDLLAPRGEDLMQQRTRCAYATDKPLWFALADDELAAFALSPGKGCRLSTANGLVIHQAFGFLVGLAAFDESLEPHVTPLL